MVDSFSRAPVLKKLTAAWKGSRRGRALLDLQNILLFGLGSQVDLLHVAVGQLLDFVQRLLFVVLGELLVFEQSLHGLIAVAPDIPHRNAVVLGGGMQFLYQLLAALLGERWNGQPDDFSVVGRIHSEGGCPNGLL